MLRPGSGQGPHCQLPPLNTEYWGREQQIHKLGELLANSYSVLLLHGPPGIGKTCLAVDVGWHMWEKGCFPGGAVLVPLKGAASARKQQQRLSEALGVHH
ncbi:kinesin light chain, partial [Haematococcus lacustris]